MVRVLRSLLFRIKQFKSYIFFEIFKIKYVKSILYENTKLKFLITNNITEYRADSFSSKEPKTLEWIKGFDENKCFWDVGANVGVYTIYSKLINKSLNVIAFEPSFKNLIILFENLKLNKLNKDVTIFSLPLSNNLGVSNFVLGDDVDGGANSTLINFNNTNRSENLNSYKSISLSVNTLINNLNLPKPDYIKIDVDGNEMEILKGINNYFGYIKEILLEVDDYKNNLKNVEDFLHKAGFFKSQIETFGYNNKTANILFKKL